MGGLLYLFVLAFVLLSKSSLLNKYRYHFMKSRAVSDCRHVAKRRPEDVVVLRASRKRRHKAACGCVIVPTPYCSAAHDFRRDLHAFNAILRGKAPKASGDIFCRVQAPALALVATTDMHPIFASGSSFSAPIKLSPRASGG